MALFAFSEKIARMADGLDSFGGFLTQALAERIRAKALGGQANLDRWVGTLKKLGRSFSRSDALHLDPRQTLLSASRELAAASRRAGAV